MSFELPTRRTAFAARPRWSGSAFLVEAMLLLVFVMASLAVFTQLFAASAERAVESRAMTDAVALAATTAERFSADPQDVERVQVVGELCAVCQVTPEARPGGTMYYATISVYEANTVPAAVDAAADASQASVVAVPVDVDESSAAAAPAQEAQEQAAPEDDAITAEPLYAISTARYVSGVRHG